MDQSSALYNLLCDKLIPLAAGHSELLSGILRGVLSVKKQEISSRIFGDDGALSRLGLVTAEGELQEQIISDFIDGFFGDKPSVAVNLRKELPVLVGSLAENPLWEQLDLGTLNLSRDLLQEYLSYFQRD